MAQNFCHHCGNAAHPNDLYCIKCGTRLGLKNEPVTPASQEISQPDPPETTDPLPTDITGLLTEVTVADTQQQLPRTAPPPEPVRQESQGSLQAPYGSEDTCENCQARTRLGAYYHFLQGIKAGTSIADQERNAAADRLAESDGVYLCNKCVALHDSRKTRKRFRMVTWAVVALLVLSIPVSMILNNLFFLFPTLLLIFTGPLAIFNQQAMRIKEKAPLRAYASIYNNPGHPNPRNSPDPLQEQVFRNTAEKLAIALKKPALLQSGVDTFLTHAEMVEPQAAGKEPAPEPWSKAISSGLASALVAGLAAGFGNGQLGFGAWLVCYFLFIHWLKPDNRKYLAIAIMLALGSLIAVIIQNLR